LNQSKATNKRISLQELTLLENQSETSVITPRVRVTSARVPNIGIKLFSNPEKESDDTTGLKKSKVIRGESTQATANKPKIYQRENEV